jgi:flagellar assembly protein FliH
MASKDSLESKVTLYHPVPFNFVDFESRASEYLSRVKSEAIQVASEARNEVFRIREEARVERMRAHSELERARVEADRETSLIREQLSELHKNLQREESSFKRRKEELEGEVLKLKAQLKESEEESCKRGYEEGHRLGYEAGRLQGYSDGELQATIDYAEKVRREAEIQLGLRLETLLPSLKKLMEGLESAKQSFLREWEGSAIKVLVSIAERVIFRKLPEFLELPLELLRESLELGVGSAMLRIRMNPVDYESLRPQVEILVREMSGVVHVQIIPDPEILLGGCVLETSLGRIDNQIGTRLERIEQELLCS